MKMMIKYVYNEWVFTLVLTYFNISQNVINVIWFLLQVVRCLIVLSVDRMNAVAVYIDEILELVGLPSVFPFRKQEAQLMLTTGSKRLAVSRGQQTWYHFTCYI